MKALAYGLVAAAALTLAVPANAQVRIYGSEDGVAVRVGPGHDRHRYRNYHHYRTYDSHAECRTVTVRKRMPNGSVVVRKTRSC